MSKSVIVLFNPVAGRQSPNIIRNKLDFVLSKSQNSIQVIDTIPGKVAEQARKAAKEADIVVAAGGDGTLHAVIQGVVGTSAAIGLIPLGTGNDFARTIGVPSDLSSAIEVLQRCDPLPTDLIRYQTATSEGWLINIGGIGFDAAVAERINTGFRGLKGTTAYLAAVFRCLATYRAIPVKATLDSKVREAPAMLCAVANARYYGGGMQVAPLARVDDGLLDVVMVQKVSKVEFLLQLPRVFKGTHLSHRCVFSDKSYRVTLETSTPMPVLADGEIVGQTPVTFEVVPGAVKMIRPH
jgi:diacylglycerol kinase (ATP)